MPRPVKSMLAMTAQEKRDFDLHARRIISINNVGKKSKYKNI